MKRIIQTSEETTPSLLSNKTKRVYKHKTNKNFSKRDEDRILKFALKQSEIEFKENHAKSTEYLIDYRSIPPCKIINATEEDFLNPIQFFESIWEKNQHSTGIIKIIPPAGWKQNIASTFQNTYLRKFEECEKKLETRKMNLNKLYTAKVKYIYILNYNNTF